MTRARYVLSTADDRVWRSRHAMGLVAVALAILAFAWSAGSAIAWLAFQLWLPVIVVTWTVRAVSATTLFSFVALGATVSAPLAALIVGVTTGGDNIDGMTTRSVWVPLVEEATKILPLAAVFAFRRSRLRRAPGLTDSLLLGLALGAGFSLVEDLARGWNWDRLTALRYGPSLGSWYLFPTADRQEAVSSTITTVFPGHALLTAWVGLAFGVAARQALNRPRVNWALPATVFALSVATHGFFNATSSGDLEVPGAALQWVSTLRGHLLLWTFPIALLGAVWRDRQVLRTVPAAGPLPLRVRRWLRYAAP